jgi:hypothetical protein
MITYGLLDPLAVTPSDTQNIVRPGYTAAGAATVAQSNVNLNFIGTGAINTVKPQTNWPVAISVGAAGNVSIVDTLGNTQVLALGTNEQYFVRYVRVNSTGTSATGIVAYFPVYE